MIPVTRQNAGCVCLLVLCMHACLKCLNLRYEHEMTKFVWMHTAPWYAYPETHLDPTMHFGFMHKVLFLKYLVTRTKNNKRGITSSPLARWKSYNYIQRYHYNIDIWFDAELEPFQNSLINFSVNVPLSNTLVFLKSLWNVQLYPFLPSTMSPRHHFYKKK